MTTTAAGTILALDLGKYKTVACAYGPGTAEPRFETLTTSREELRKLFARRRPAAVVIEACLLAGWVHDLCHELGLACHVANTASEAWKFKHAKRKTDRDDALRLAPLFALGQLPTVTVPPPATRQWRSLIAARQGLVGRRVAVQNRVRAILVGQGLPAPRGAKAWAARGLEGIGRRAKPLADCGPGELWRGLLELALTELRQVRQLADQAEARLDQPGQAERRRAALGDGARRRPAHRRGHRRPPAPARPLRRRQAGLRLRRAGAAPGPIGRAGPPRPHHAARPGAVAPAAGRVRLGQAALQQLGTGRLPKAQSRPGAQEAGDRGAGA
jgi:transposase